MGTPNKLIGKEDVVRDMHSKGCTAEEISRKVIVSSNTVRKWLDKHNLPRRRLGDPVTNRTRELCREAMLRHLLKQDKSCIQQSKLVKERLACMDQWRHADTQRQVQILEILESGPITRDGIAAKMGMSGSRNCWIIRNLRVLRKRKAVGVEYSADWPPTHVWKLLVRRDGMPIRRA